MTTGTKKKFKLKLVGEDGNAFAIMARFQRAARKAGWTMEEINAVLNEAMDGDSSHFLATVMKHTTGN
jgi:hypothetical protein